MSRHEAPAYFCATERVGRNPPDESCVEGRLFVEDRRLVCGAGDPTVQSGYVGKVDDHAGSTVRRFLGGFKGFQEFEVEEAASRERTRSVAFAGVTGVEFAEWQGSELKGADRTYAVVVDAAELTGESLVIQLGRGWRNRGSGRQRHAALARVVRALSAEADAESDAPPANKVASGDSGAVASGGSGTVAATAATASGATTETASGATTEIASGTTGGETDASGFDGETGDTTLVARNDTGSPVSARIGCRTDEGTEFAEDVTIPSGEREEWTDLPADRAFEIGVSVEGGDNALTEFEGAETVRGDIHVYLAPDDVVVDTSTPGSVATGATETETAGTTAERTDATPDRRGATSDAAVESTRESASEGSRLKSAGIALVGVVVWFGSALLQPSVALPGRGVPYSADPSLVQTLETAQAVVAFLGVGVLLYGLYSFVTGGK
ncbi:hypothetical protein [Halorussus salinus]|uniref:hypothetical protein n=1 Tax=Halorussus salinus TaxID=1364935 RepID=UPI0010928D62|nr:hypothetical protein [Halorussus salinus]